MCIVVPYNEPELVRGRNVIELINDYSGALCLFVNYFKPRNVEQKSFAKHASFFTVGLDIVFESFKVDIEYLSVKTIDFVFCFCVIHILKDKFACNGTIDILLDEVSLKSLEVSVVSRIVATTDFNLMSNLVTERPGRTDANTTEVHLNGNGSLDCLPALPTNLKSTAGSALANLLEFQRELADIHILANVAVKFGECFLIFVHIVCI